MALFSGAGLAAEEEEEEEAAAAEAEYESFGAQWRPDLMMWAKALLLEAGGRHEEALRLLAKAWELCGGAGVAAEYG